MPGSLRSTTVEGMSEPRSWRLAGRDDEVALLHSRAELARQGRGSVVVLSGEAGSGKSALVQELSGWAQAHGMKSGIGRASADRALPPLSPWVETIVACGMGLEGAALAPELQRLVSSNPEEDPSGVDLARTFEQAAALLRSCARTQPMLVAIEDIHQADEPTLRLLEYLASMLDRLAVLLVVTTRDVPMGSSAARTLAYLQREPSARRIVVPALTQAVVRQLIVERTGMEPAPSFVDGLMSATGGNALFVFELLDDVRPGDVVFGGTLRAWPANIQDAVAGRVAQLTTAAQGTLQAASVVGNRFDVEVLSAFADGDIGALVGEAAMAGLVRPAERFGSYSFAHSIVRDVLYDGLSVADRRALHAQVAKALDTGKDTLGSEDLAELALHYERALPGGDPLRATKICRLAGEDARRRFDPGAAAEHFQFAQTAAWLADLGETEQTTIRFLLGDAQVRSGNVRGGKETLAEAFRRADALGDDLLLARIALSYSELIEAGVADPNRMEFLERAVVGLSPEDRLFVPVLSLLAETESISGRPTEGRAHSLEALELARSSADPFAIATAINGRQWTLRNSGDFEERIRLGAEMVDAARLAGNRELSVKAHRWQLVTALESGNRALFEQEVLEHEKAATVLREPVLVWRSACHRALLAFLDGDFGRAEREISNAIELSRHMNSRGSVRFAMMQYYMLRKAQGRLAEIYEDGRTQSAPGFSGAFLDAMMAVGAAKAGDADEARVRIARAYSLGTVEGFTATAGLGPAYVLAEAVAEVGPVEIGQELLAELRPHMHRVAAFGDGVMVMGPVALAVARLEWFLGLVDQAGESVEQAITVAERLGSRTMVIEARAFRAILLRERDVELARGLAVEVLADARATGMGDVARDLAEAFSL